MSVPTPVELLSFLQEHGFLTLAQGQQVSGPTFADARTLARELVDRNWLTPYQANQLLQGRGADLLLGPYRIFDRLGEGGMGQVFKAYHDAMDRLVALKVITKDRVSNPTAVARFFREVRAVAKLSHPNIVTAFEVNQAGETPFLAMEYVEGIDLARLVQQSGPLPIPRACEYVRQVALGLQHAHEKGLVHRDIKPGNLIVTRPGPDAPPLIKILDFGLARFESESDHVGRLTQLGKMVGTVDYMAPEQAHNARTADIRADIYSLGCTLFYLLTGKPPFQGEDTVERIGAKVLGDVPPLRESRPEVSPALESVVRSMMARKPLERYQTPGEVAEALQPHALPEGEKRRVARTVVDRSIAPPPISPTRIKAPPQAIPLLPTKKVVALQKAGEREPRPPRLKPSVWIALAGMAAFGAVAALGIFVVVIVLFANSRAGDSKGGDSTKGPALAHKDTNADNSKPAGLGDKGRPPVEPKKVEPMPEPKKPDSMLSVDLSNGVTMEFVLIPKGKFTMGSPPGEKGHENYEEQHEVEISKPFYLAKYPVTQQQYQALMKVNPSYFQAGKGGANKVKGLDTDQLPVEDVSWDDAQAFCQKMRENDQQKRTFRLPTEAEWEYACRAGTQTAYFFGDDDKNLGEYAWFEGNSGGRTHDVGTKKPNPWGLYDMHGNVWQWCAGVFAFDYPKGAVTDPQGPKEGDSRAFRGGCWSFNPLRCRSAHRGWLVNPSRHQSLIGFRLAVSPTDPDPLPPILQPQKPKESDQPPVLPVSLPQTQTVDVGGGVTMEFVLIPKGKFTMGSPPGEKGRNPWDKSIDVEVQREVEFTKAFYMGKYPVTQEQYEAITGKTIPLRFPPKGQVGQNIKRFPVDDILWEDAKAFCEKMMNKDKQSRKFRLPSEAEWEYACRAGTKTTYFFGDDPTNLGEYAWFDGNSGAHTHEVGTKKANPWGLYDMIGNVRQWCLDFYPNGHRVLRGGSALYNAQNCRAACRSWDAPNYRKDGGVGFRVVTDILMEPKKVEVTPVPPVSPPPFVKLFNGKDLTGWKTYPAQADNWRVEKGVLIGSGPTVSHLATERNDYKNFHLRVEARVNDGGDSGVYFRAKLGPAYPVGYEAQINSTHRDVHKTGSLYAGLGDAVVSVRQSPVPPGEWFTQEVIAEGNHIVIKINGKTTADYTDEKRLFATGHIALQQTLQTMAEFRKIEINELPLAKQPGQEPFPPSPFPQALTVDLGNGVKMDFVLIPKGKFMMGSPKTEKGHQDQEEQHEVEISKPFYLAKYPVTQQQYQALMKTNPSAFQAANVADRVKGRDANKVKGLDTDQFPADSIHWADAKAYCELLTKNDKQGRKFRLPTEAEWEYACRGGTKTAYFFGDDPKNLDEYAWFVGNSGGRPHDVGTKKPNPWGLYDMHGNVYQWCEDYWDVKYYANSPIKDPLNINDLHTSVRVYRGSSWDNDPTNCRAASRLNDHKVNYNHWFGFRVCLPLD